MWGRPCEDETLGPPMAQMRQWAGRSFKAEPPELTVMAGARLFPGNVQTRGKTTHTGGQLLLTDRFELTPASYNPMDGRLTLPTDVDTKAAPTPLAGDHFFLGSVHPHFGHVLLEGLSRVWAFPAFDRAHPDGRCVIYEPWTPDFALELLGRAGLPPDRILRPERPLVIERLHVPDAAIRTHQWIAAEQVQTWGRIAATFGDGATARRRIYLSRRGVTTRALTNEAEVEAIFAEAGFEIIRPEALSIVEQGRMAREAEVLAGCVGSQMYLAAFQPPGGHTLVLAPSNFFLADDSLIAGAVGHRLSVAFGGVSAYQLPQGSWSIDPSAATALIASLDG